MRNISKIIADKILGRTLIKDEELELCRWLEESDTNRDTFDRILCGELAYTILDKERAGFGAKMAYETIRRIKAKRRRNVWISAMGTAAIFTAISFMLIFQTTNQSDVQLVAEQHITNIVEREMIKRVVLLKDNGTQMNLDGNVKIDSVIRNNAESMKINTAQIISNYTIVVPHKKEYNVELPDGTKVWINSGSRLTFPSQFSDSLRVVSLEGEAFFEVSQDVKRAFIVETKNLKTRVLGTQFMVTSYNDNSSCEVALVEGCVDVSTKQINQNTILKPGFCISFNPVTTSCYVKDIDIANILNRKNELFLFDNITISSITEQLKRWYGVEFELLDEQVKELVFYLRSPKYEHIDEIMLLLKDTKKIDYTINNNIIRIKSVEPMI